MEFGLNYEEDLKRIRESLTDDGRSENVLRLMNNLPREIILTHVQAVYLQRAISLVKQLREQSVPDLMTIKSGSGRKGKTVHIEKQILAELESGNYHTRQEIVDMIRDKFHINVSRSCVGRLLKKTALNG